MVPYTGRGRLSTSSHLDNSISNFTISVRALPYDYLTCLCTVDGLTGPQHLVAMRSDVFKWLLLTSYACYIIQEQVMCSSDFPAACPGPCPQTSKHSPCRLLPRSGWRRWLGTQGESYLASLASQGRACRLMYATWPTRPGKFFYCVNFCMLRSQPIPPAVSMSTGSCRNIPAFFKFSLISAAHWPRQQMHSPLYKT